MGILSFGFVLLSLLALVVTPTLMTRALDEMRAETTARLGVIGRLVPELRLVEADQTNALQSLRISSDTPTLNIYRQSRQREEVLLDSVTALAPGVSSAAVELAGRLRVMSERLHEATDGRAEGTMTEEAYLADQPQRFALRDSVLAVNRALEREILEADASDQARGQRVVERQRIVSLVLGMVALLSALIVAGVARRQRRLGHELSESLAKEERLRAVAEQRRADLHAVSESRARLTRGFSHDVKNPLGAAEGFLALLEEGVRGELEPPQRQYVAKARRSIGSALNLIEDLLEIARAETGNVKVDWTLTDVSTVVLEAVDEYRAQAIEKGLELDVDPGIRIPIIESDPSRIRQVLGNLISNAVKYTPEGRVTVHARVRPKPGVDGAPEYVAIEVSDTGLGIPEHKRRLLFQEFTRFEPGAAKGTGIGLAISYRIVQALGGDITFEQGSQHGSVFVLWLPQRAPQAPAATGVKNEG